VADHRHVPGARRIQLLFLGERTPDDRDSAQNGEQAGRRPGALQPFWLPRTSQVEAADGAGQGDVLEHLLPAPPVEVVGGADVRQPGSHPGLGHPEGNQPVRLLIGQIAQHDPVRDGEDGGRGPAAERQHQDGGRAETGAASQSAQRVPELLDHSEGQARGNCQASGGSRQGAGDSTEKRPGVGSTIPAADTAVLVILVSEKTCGLSDLAWF
jgi:hypothetical protein